jgi:mannose-6-phosphate isomerase-like protein (cupin superfamily)
MASRVIQPGRPRVFHLADQRALPNNRLARSARVVTPESTGSARLYAGMFWSQPGSTGGWSFRGDDPDEGRTIDGMPHLGLHDEVYLCLSGRVRVTWEEGSFEFGAGDVVYFAAGHQYLTEVIGDEPVQVFYVMAPAPGWMAPLDSEERPAR